MTVEEMKKKKQELGLSYAQISESSGVPLGTLQKIFNGETASPRYATIQALEDFFRAEETPRVSYSSVPKVNCMVMETSQYNFKKKQGEFTLDDYYALPDDVRAELIDGVLYDMATPTKIHQLIAGDIYRQIANFIIDNNGKCAPFIAPLDVRLDCDDRTMVEPDVMIACNQKEDEWGMRHIEGAPDFVLEVISPSTGRKDYTIKTSKYDNAGVREFWIVDPYKKVILVYDFEHNDMVNIYPLGEDVPVRIYDGKLVISTKRCLEWAEKL